MKGAVPFRLVDRGGTPEVEWVWAEGARFTEPFFEDTVGRLARENPANRRAQRPRTSIDALHDAEERPLPSALIFHVSRCGSTLLTQMLAALPNHHVISEPPILDDLLRLNQRQPACSDEKRVRLLRAAARALAWPLAGSAGRFFIKLDSWHLFSLPLFQQAFPGVPLLFIYRHPLEVLVSLMRRPSLTLVRDTITPEQLGLSADTRVALSAEEHAAAILGAFFRTARTHRASLIPIAYEKLPAAALDALATVPFTAEERERLLDAAQYDAKNPGARFVSDGAQKRQEASPALLAAAERWALPAYQRWLATLSAATCPRFSSYPATGPKCSVLPCSDDGTHSINVRSGRSSIARNPSLT